MTLATDEMIKSGLRNKVCYECFIRHSFHSVGAVSPIVN